MAEIKSAEKDNQLQIFFGGGTPVKEAAGFIVHSYEQGKKIQFRAIGAGAVCQMYKAMATTNYLLAQKGLVASFRPGFDTIKRTKDGDDKETTVMIGYMDVR